MGVISVYVIVKYMMPHYGSQWKCINTEIQAAQEQILVRLQNPNGKTQT